MKLPDDIRVSSTPRTLLAEAAALLKAGGNREDVLRCLVETAPSKANQYAQAHLRARDEMGAVDVFVVETPGGGGCGRA